MALAVVVANMVGTGVFTSLGFQLVGLTDWVTIVLLWLSGGVIAFCGALTYAELASHLPDSGGEYQYLTKLWHPALGFMSAWVSATVGFSAPIALAAIAMANYLQLFLPALDVRIMATAVIVGLTLMHSNFLNIGARFQVIFTVAKVILMVLIILIGLLFAPGVVPSKGFELVGKELLSSSFATSLVFVSYAFSGWNAATYISGEIKNPRFNIPVALLGGTMLVALLYALINYSFLAMAPASVLVGKLEVGKDAVTNFLGPTVGNATSAVIALLLISTISAMVFAGPRLLAALGDDVKGLSWLSIRNKVGLPYVAGIFQLAIALAFVWTGKFEQVLVFSGGILCLFTMLTTLSVFRLRYLVKQKVIVLPTQEDQPFKVWAYPLPPILFLALNGYMMYFLASSQPSEFIGSLVLVLAGICVYVVAVNKKA
jgi:APA family basic amino acid/polyamine antiporter